MIVYGPCDCCLTARRSLVHVHVQASSVGSVHGFSLSTAEMPHQCHPELKEFWRCFLMAKVIPFCLYQMPWQVKLAGL